MIVFKTYFKLVKKYIPTILMYIGIFTIFAVISTSNADSSMNFKESKPKVSIINHDKYSVITENFIDYIKDNAKVIKLESTDDSLKDALFFRKVDYILEIEEGFGKSILEGNPKKVKTMKVPDSYASIYLEMLLNRYLNISSIYVDVGMSEEKIVSLINKDLKMNTKVVLLEEKKNDLDRAKYFFYFSNYTILATCILVIGMIINIFNDDNIKKKNFIGMLPYTKINKILFSGNFILTLGIWLIYIIISIIMFKETMFTPNGLLLMLNSLIFSFMALSLGFLIGNLVKNKEAQSGIVNVIALGSSFICGAFVPSQYLGEMVINISKILPSYWFIKNNELIYSLNNYNFENVQIIIINLIIVFLYGIFIFMFTNLLMKRKQR